MLIKGHHARRDLDHQKTSVKIPYQNKTESLGMEDFVMSGTLAQN